MKIQKRKAAYPIVIRLRNDAESKRSRKYLTTHRLLVQRFHIRRWDRSRIRVFEYFSLEITEGDFVRTAINDVVRIDRYFPAAAGAIDNELRDGVSGGMTAEFFDDVHAFGYGCAEVRRTGDEIALIEIVRADAGHQKFMH